MILTKDELMKKLSAIIGDRNDDDAITFIEDVSDTVDSFNKTKDTDWKTKYEELDKSWRERYKERFFSELPEVHTEEISDQIEDQTEDLEKDLTFEALFEESEVK